MQKQDDYDPIYQDKIRAGMRTYFFDIKNGNRSKYLIVTESKRQPDGYYKKHKIMVFPEDVEKLKEAFNKAFDQLLDGYDGEQKSGYRPEPEGEQSSEEDIKVDDIDTGQDAIQVEF